MDEGILKDLNREQLEVIENLEGPLLIVAGAGTGKTKVVTHSIVHLIRSKFDVEPSNILALTFSRKASEEMLNRAEGLLGEYKGEIAISTFHSFCHKLLKNHAIDAGIPPSFRLLDRVEQWIFFKEIIPSLKLKLYLNIADPTSPLHGFIRFISRAKDELVTPQQYMDFAKNINDKEERAHQEEIARVYAVYQESLLRRGYLDFGDLINHTIKLFHKRPSILKQHQEQFKFIIVDEFQDTNIAQIELVSLVANKYRNICVVGDDDQCIYRFRGASYASFVKFKEKFPDAKVLKLTQNYRSTKKIIHVAEQLISYNNPDRYDPDKKLWTENKSGILIEILKRDSREWEAKTIANKIKLLVQNKKIDYSDIAVLYRAHNYKEALVKRLELENIPYTVAGGVGLLERAEIRELLGFLKVIDNPMDNACIFNTLSSLDFEINLHDLIKISTAAKSREVSIYELLNEKSLNTLAISQKTTDAIRHFELTLKKLMRLSHGANVEDLFYQLLEETGYLKNLLAHSSEENEIKAGNIGLLYNFIKKFAEEHKKNDLHSFLEYTDSYIQAEGELHEEEQLKIQKGVQLSTIHQAKGLEFPYVFVIGLIEGRFPTRQRPDPIVFPEELMKEELPKGDFHIQEERRLCYVACTRAKEALFLSTVVKPYSKQSRFLEEIQKGKPKDIDILSEESGEKGKEESVFPLPEIEGDRIKQKRRILRMLDSFDDAALKDKKVFDEKFELLKNEISELARLSSKKSKEGELDISTTSIKTPEEIRLSYTQVEAYMVCPLKYKFGYIYNIPVRPTLAVRFGLDIHQTLAEFFNLVKGGAKARLADLERIFLRHWQDENYPNKFQRLQYKKKGHQILKRFYKTNKDNLKAPLYIEEEFLLWVGDYRLKGVIDRIDELKDGIEIIDYKTGRERSKAYADKNIQLDIYAIAASEVLNLKPVQLSLYYLDANKKISTTRAPEDLAAAKGRIIEVGNKIKQKEFPPNPGRICRWCDYKIMCPAAMV